MAATPETPTRERTSAPPIDRHAAPVAHRGDKSGRATAAMIVAIVGLPVAFLYPFGGIVLGLIGIALGATARLEAERQGFTNTGHAMAGLIIGTIDLLLGIVIIAVVASSHS